MKLRTIINIKNGPGMSSPPKEEKAGEIREIASGASPLPGVRIRL